MACTGGKIENGVKTVSMGARRWQESTIKWPAIPAAFMSVLGVNKVVGDSEQRRPERLAEGFGETSVEAGVWKRWLERVIKGSQKNIRGVCSVEQVVGRASDCRMAPKCKATTAAEKTKKRRVAGTSPASMPSRCVRRRSMGLWQQAHH